jgi:hypothetical protein
MQAELDFSVEVDSIDWDRRPNNAIERPCLVALCNASVTGTRKLAWNSRISQRTTQLQVKHDGRTLFYHTSLSIRLIRYVESGLTATLSTLNSIGKRKTY